MKTKQLLGLIGAIVLFIGVFVPIVDQPIMGSTDYFRNGRGGGVLVLLFAVVSFVLVLRKTYRWLWLTGGASLAVSLYTFIFMVRDLSMFSDGYSTLRKFGVTPSFEPMHLQFGWGLLFVGAGLVIASAALKEEQI
jgi:hypothetical protein